MRTMTRSDPASLRSSSGMSSAAVESASSHSPSMPSASMRFTVRRRAVSASHSPSRPGETVPSRAGSASSASRRRRRAASSPSVSAFAAAAGPRYDRSASAWLNVSSDASSIRPRSLARRSPRS